MPLEVGSRLGHYTVDALIGEGGMGQVTCGGPGSRRASSFDQEHLEVTGDPVPVVENVANKLSTGAGNFALSDTGNLVYVSGTEGGSSLRRFAPAP